MENTVMLSCSRSSNSHFASSRFYFSAAALGLAALGLAAPHPALAQTAVLTQNNDNARTGSNTTETTLTPKNVTVTTFGKLFTITGLNANVNGQVLYVPGVTIGGAAHNVVYAYTSNNTDNSPCGLYAYDADTGTQLWATVLPNSATYTTATPVIDPATNLMYVLTKTGTDNTGATYLRVFDITTGVEKTSQPTQVTASATGTGDGSIGGKVYFDGVTGNNRFHANDRAALLLANGFVYASFAHNSDSFPYHGWVLAYKYSNGTLSQVASFCTTPNGSDGGVWQSGKGLAADAAGNIYFAIGNGTFDANTGGSDYGMCYMKLSPSLQVLDYFTSFDESGLSNEDLDLGNAGVVGIPGTTALFGGATKFGSAFLMDSANLGKFTTNGPDNVLDRIDGVSANDQVGQNPIAWDSGNYKYVYLWPSGQPVKQFRYDPSVGTLNPKGTTFATASSSITDGGSLAVSSSGTASAILWAIGDNGTVRAYDATNVANPELWDSAQNSSRDGIGHSGHFQFPTVVNGKVYVPTGGSTIAVYGLLQAPAPPPASTTINDTSGSLAYTGSGWFYNAGRGLGDFQNDVHATTNNGNAVSCTFTGTAVSFLTETNADEGNIQVYLDGTLQATVSAYSAARKVQQTLWSTSGLTAGSHTLKLVKASGSYMVLDAFQVTPLPVAAGLVNDTNSSITYGGASWGYYPNRGVGDVNDDVHAAYANGDYLTFSFTGTSVSYITETNSDEGNVQVYIDDTLQATVSAYSAARQTQQTIWSASGLTAGSHTLKLVKAGGSYLVLDAFQATPTSSVSSTTVNDNGAGLVYSGSGWFYNSGRGPGDVDSDVHATANNGDAVSCTFTGTAVSYITETNSDEGTVQVYIDGTLTQTVNCNTAARADDQSVYSVSGLSSGSHTIKLVKTGGTYMLLDAISFQ
jgi:hypothetical protein